MMNRFRQRLIAFGCLCFLVQPSFAQSTISGDINEAVRQRRLTSPIADQERLNPTQTLKPLRIAFCITGQLARLEILSKIKNVLLKNAEVGHTPHVFIFLDDDVQNVKQTYWRYDYKSSLYGMYKPSDLKELIDTSIKELKNHEKMKTFVRFEAPPRNVFEVFYNESVPVSDKAYSGHDGPKDNFEPAVSRFQNNMRWMAGLRECARFVKNVLVQCSV